MEYHKLLDTIKHDHKNNESLMDSCIIFIDYVASKPDKSLFDYLSFDIISQIIPNTSYDEILSVTQYFTDPAINVLILQFHYFSITTDREDPYPIDGAEVYDALEKNIFYDPLSGEVDLDYKHYIKLFYTLSEPARGLNKK